MIFKGIILILPSVLFAQFSPGALSKYHSHLEGNKNCIQCHEIGNKELSDGCINCHSPLKRRINATAGYHRDKKRDCGSCHSDHNGRAFELVYWPKDISNFNHNETGYSLTGGHEKVKCAKCHDKSYITWEPILLWAKEKSRPSVLNRTFLGLDSTCNVCHEDIHKGQVSSDCASCHNTTDWELVIRDFDHNRAKFLLNGAHKKVKCEKCHPVQPDHPRKVWQLTGMAFDNCTQCHEDVHKGSFGPTCESCHSTLDWKKELKVFDHSKTQYPLLGKHAAVSCVQCHQLTLAGGLPQFKACMDCHEDKHYDQFIFRPDKGECGACHTVDGFKPTTFTPTLHESARFILDGAHRAIPCSGCHKPYRPEKNISTIQFTWKDLSCLPCHDDVHRGQMKRNYNNRCEACHNSTSFIPSITDHGETAFPLDGKHKNVPCSDCHKTEKDPRGVFIRYQPVSHDCRDCHTFTGQIR